MTMTKELQTTPHIGCRTGVDFSGHELHVVKTDEILIHHLKKPDTHYDSIKFINTQDVMSVTGDFGNWIFCREFHPSIDGCEKLVTASTQKPYELLQGEIDEFEENPNDYSSDQEQQEEFLEYLKDCQHHSDSEFEYTSFAYTNNHNLMEAEDVPYGETIQTWLQIIFDGFEDICSRMKKEEHEA